MKLYKIRHWNEIFENSRSREVKDLRWVPIPNSHDGETYSLIMEHEKGAEIFTCWILILQVASRCRARGTLLRGDGSPHSARTLSIKTRGKKEWFETALNYLENNTDWLDVEDVAEEPQDTVTLLPSVPHPSAEERKKEGNGSEEGHIHLNGRFVKPTVDEIKARFRDLGVSSFEPEAERFWSYYESNGWKVGRNSMKSWQAACVNWSKNIRTTAKPRESFI